MCSSDLTGGTGPKAANRHHGTSAVTGPASCHRTCRERRTTAVAARARHQHRAWARHTASASRHRQGPRLRPDLAIPPGLRPGLDLSYFDNCVNEGPRRATILLQQALHVQADGVWGPGTQKAVDAATNIVALVKEYSDWRARFYRGLGTFQYFGKGWIARVNYIEQASLKMVKS